MRTFKLELAVPERDLGEAMAHALSSNYTVLSCLLLEPAKASEAKAKAKAEAKAKIVRKYLGVGVSATRVLEALRDGTPLSRAELNERVGDLSERAVDSALHRLRVDARIKSVSPGVYQLNFEPRNP